MPGFWIEDRILHVEYKPEIFIDLEAARLIVADRVTFQKGKPYPILCYTEGITSSNKAARDYLCSKRFYSFQSHSLYRCSYGIPGNAQLFY